MAIRFAVAALTAESFRAYALFNGLSLLDDAHFFVAAVAQKFDCRKYTRRTCADDANEADDFELQRMIGTFKLLRDKGYTMRILPGTPEENAPVFDFAAESIQPAA